MRKMGTIEVLDDEETDKKESSNAAHFNTLLNVMKTPSTSSPADHVTENTTRDATRDAISDNVTVCNTSTNTEKLPTILSNRQIGCFRL